jgi:hypothetical protein
MTNRSVRVRRPEGHNVPSPFPRKAVPTRPDALMVSSASIGDSEREERRWSDLVGVRRWWEGIKCWLTGVI